MTGVFKGEHRTQCGQSSESGGQQNKMRDNRLLGECRPWALSLNEMGEEAKVGPKD